MKLHYTKYKKKYERYILSIVANEMKENGIKKIDDNSIITYLFNRFCKECDWNKYGTLDMIKQNKMVLKKQGLQKAITEWLSGLAINIPCYNGDIIDLAIKMGSINKNPSDKLIDKVVANYFNFMTNIILSLFNPRRIKDN